MGWLRGWGERERERGEGVQTVQVHRPIAVEECAVCAVRDVTELVSHTLTHGLPPTSGIPEDKTEGEGGGERERELYDFYCLVFIVVSDTVHSDTGTSFSNIYRCPLGRHLA